MEYITVTVSLMGTTRLLSLKRITALLQKLAVLTSQQADALLNWKSLMQSYNHGSENLILLCQKLHAKEISELFESNGQLC